jgi:hypothetical protein
MRAHVGHDRQHDGRLCRPTEALRGTNDSEYPDTVKAARHDLLRNGIRFEVLWKIATGRLRLRRS